MQVLSLWDSLSCAAVLRLVRLVTAPPLQSGEGAGARRAAAQASARAAAASEGADMDFEGVGGHATAASKPGDAVLEAGAAQARLPAILDGLAELLQGWPLRDQPDTLRSIAETLAEAAISPQATGASLIKVSVFQHAARKCCGRGVRAQCPPQP